MKNLKKHLSLLLSLVLLLTLLPRLSLTARAETYSGTCGKNLTWTLDTETGLLTIEGSGAMEYGPYSDDVPWYDYCSSIKTVSLPDGLTDIGQHAFNNCTNLTNVTIPYGVEYIGEFAFNYCTSLP